MAKMSLKVTDLRCKICMTSEPASPKIAGYISKKIPGYKAFGKKSVIAEHTRIAYS